LSKRRNFGFDFGITCLPHEVFMPLDRRTFLAQSAALAAAFSASARAADVPAASDPIARMTWLNEPAFWKASNGVVQARPKAKTDFWRKTFTNTVSDNGHFFHLTASGEFAFEARVWGNYAAEYDHAGIMLRLDAENWMKCGTEFFGSARQASVVFTRGFSDWSTMKDLSTNAPVWWRVERRKNSVEVKYSPDGKAFVMVRSGYFPPAEKCEVGVMCAAPEGDGFGCSFDYLKLT
jgi:uncharacterized protein